MYLTFTRFHQMKDLVLFSGDGWMGGVGVQPLARPSSTGVVISFRSA